MIYDPIELAKLNTSEADIQRQRDFVKEALTKPYSKDIELVVFKMDRFWLPFVVDLFGSEFSVQGSHITIKLNP